MHTLPFGIAIHGGSGNIKKSNMPKGLEQAYFDFLKITVEIGHDILANGGTAREAVKQCLIPLEESPLFNAAKGAVLNAEGNAELDAAMMDGGIKKAGAVSGTRCIKNPILAAEAVLLHSPHVLLSGTGADTFAKEQGLELVNPAYFITEARKIQLAKHQYYAKPQMESTAFDSAENEFNMLIEREEKFGTVGAVALDKAGNLVAGTSTGGMTNKKYGRIGDSPIIGAGTFANNETCAVSCTGHGEYFIQTAVAHNLHARLKYLKEPLQNAAELVLEEPLNLGGFGGLISIDKHGNISMPFTTQGMFRASKDYLNNLTIGIYKNA